MVQTMVLRNYCYLWVYESYMRRSMVFLDRIRSLVCELEAARLPSPQTACSTIYC